MSNLRIFWNSVHNNLFEINNAVKPTYCKFFNNVHRGVYFTHIKNNNDEDELKASINEHMRNNKKINGIIQINNFNCHGDTNIYDLININYGLNYKYSYHDNILSTVPYEKNYMMFFNDIDEKNWIDTDIKKWYNKHMSFFSKMMHLSCNYGKIFNVVLVRDKNIYEQLLRINEGCKVYGFDRSGVLLDKQFDILEEFRI